MIVWVNERLIARRAAQNHRGAVGDYLVGVHIGARAAARLEHVDREVIIEFPTPDDFVPYYNLACALSMQGKTDEAMLSLIDAVEHGFSDVVQLQRDHYLTSLRTHERFQNLIDRWDAVLLGGEMGRRILGDRGWRLDVFAGLGVDLIKPLGGSNELLTALQASVGAGMRYDIEEDGPWYMGFDVRAEYVGDRNEELVNLGGGAWSVRFMVGRILTTSDQETRELLGR